MFMKLKIIDMDHNGRGIAKIDGKVCFIENALIGEEVDANIYLDKKKYMEAKVNSILVSSDKRVKEKCKYASICGGCNIMNMDYQNQILYKKNKVIEIFKKFCKSEIKIDEFISGNELYYRNKLTLHIDKKIGLYANKTKDIIEINECLIVNKKINEIYSIIKTCNLSNISTILIRVGVNTNESMVVVETNFDIFDLKNKLNNIIDTLVVKRNDEFITLFGNGYIYEKLNGLNFLISPDSFFQVNTLQAEKLYSKVKEYLGKSNNVLDLYCGTGTIGIYVSDIAQSVLGIEINKYAVKDANENKKINNINNIEFICGDSEKVLYKINRKFDSVIVDPPRSGLGEKVVQQLLKINPKKIVYVSCNPITLARDINYLSSNYELVNISLVDMFPNTHHVECVVVLKLK